MDVKALRDEVYKVRYKIITMSPNDKANPNHPLYEELKRVKKAYTQALCEIKEKEIEENEQHKRK